MHSMLLMAGMALAGPPAVTVPKPDPKSLCPVCGMLVSKYPNWTATALYKDGQAHHFDGAKDLFKYLHNLRKFAPGRDSRELATLAVTEYYGLTRIDARTAFFVIGSDVLGPMGHELVPLANRVEAEEFLKDHKGRRILEFKDVTRTLAEKLDAGRFD